MTHTSDIPATYVRWSDIKEVSAYTADDFTVDALCVEITTLTGQVCLFTEDVDGFSVFIEQMGKGIPTIPADWYQKIIQPAFAENHTILFEKEI